MRPLGPRALLRNKEKRNLKAFPGLGCAPRPARTHPPRALRVAALQALGPGFGVPRSELPQPRHAPPGALCPLLPRGALVCGALGGTPNPIHPWGAPGGPRERRALVGLRSWDDTPPKPPFHPAPLCWAGLGWGPPYHSPPETNPAGPWGMEEGAAPWELPGGVPKLGGCAAPRDAQDPPRQPRGRCLRSPHARAPARCSRLGLRLRCSRVPGPAPDTGDRRLRGGPRGPDHPDSGFWGPGCC